MHKNLITDGNVVCSHIFESDIENMKAVVHVFEKLWKSRNAILKNSTMWEGVYAPGGPAFLAHAKQKVSSIVGLTALRLAFFMEYE